MQDGGHSLLGVRNRGPIRRRAAIAGFVATGCGPFLGACSATATHPIRTTTRLTVLPASTTPEPPRAEVTTTTGSTPPTTIVQAAACLPSQFAVVLATDHATYQTGHTVQITMSVRNDGPTCRGLDAASSGACGLGRLTASGESGQEVWDSDGNPYGDSYACPDIGFQSVHAGWSTTVQFSWTQDECVSGASQGPPQTNPECPQTQVAPGTYSLVGFWNETLTVGAESQSHPVTITIAQ